MAVSIIPRKTIIAVDFDDTLTEHSPYPITGKIREDAIKYINLLNKQGYIFKLNTARRGKWRREAIKLIKASGLPIDCKYKRKPFADYYIDDKNIFCGEIDWKFIYNYLSDDSFLDK